jgi:meso-butanediol dehydrogenase/(S,S)-butanediol dehydrogenase/diacetyl reductase
MMFRNAVITGASSGLGLLLAGRMEREGFRVIDWSIETGVNVADAQSVSAAAAKLDGIDVDVLINCAGANGIDFLPEVTEADWDRIVGANAKGIFLCTQALLDNLVSGTVVNIVSNAAHIPMTNSLAYNASKGAALIMTKQLNRELRKTHDITVFSVSPNKLKGTGMSRYIERRVCDLRGWTEEEAKRYQLAALPAGEETDPDTLAEFITFLLSTKQRHKYLAGCDIPYGA